MLFAKQKSSGLGEGAFCRREGIASEGGEPPSKLAYVSALIPILHNDMRN